MRIIKRKEKKRLEIITTSSQAGESRELKTRGHKVRVIVDYMTLVEVGLRSNG